MLKYELKKYILKPSVIICLAVLLLVNLVKVLEIYCQGSGRQILFSGKGRIEISKDVLYEKYGAADTRISGTGFSGERNDDARGRRSG